MDERDKLITENMGLVHTCAKRFLNRRIDYDDLVQAGSIGLIKAIDGFDESKGFKLSTYAVPIILGEMKRLFRDGGTVKVSRTLKELSLKVTRESIKFYSNNGRQPSINELSKILNVENTQIAQALNSAQIPLSLSKIEEDDANGSNQIDIPIESVEEKLAEMLSLKQALTELDPKDRTLIILRFFENNTQIKTGELLSMTQVQVSRKEKKILKDIRNKLTVK